MTARLPNLQLCTSLAKVGICFQLFLGRLREKKFKRGTSIWHIFAPTSWRRFFDSLMLIFGWKLTMSECSTVHISEEPCLLPGFYFIYKLRVGALRTRYKRKQIPIFGNERVHYFLTNAEEKFWVVCDITDGNKRGSIRRTSGACFMFFVI